MTVPPSPAAPGPSAANATATVPPSGPSWSADAVGLLADAVGATLNVDACGPLLRIGTDVMPPQGGVAPLSEIGLISVTGADAVSFLHGQLTQDVEHLSPGVARWAGFCSPKGRLLSTFRLWRDESALYLSLARPVAAPIAKRLSMFVLRAKARVVNASDAWVCFGLAGDAAAQAAAKWLGRAVPQADAAACGLGSDGLARGHLVGLPAVTVPGADAPLPRWLLVVAAESATEVWGCLTAASAPMSGLAWRHAEVLSAIPRIVPATQELFVPQMINFESVDGVNFRKGCYPGQEVVARSQYLGKLKRRMFLAHGVGVEPLPGSDVLAADAGEPCGQVVLAAPDGAGGFDLLFESRTDALEAGPPRTVDGTVLTVRALPYALKSID